MEGVEGARIVSPDEVKEMVSFLKTDDLKVRTIISLNFQSNGTNISNREHQFYHEPTYNRYDSFRAPSMSLVTVLYRRRTQL